MNLELIEDGGNTELKSFEGGLDIDEEYFNNYNVFQPSKKDPTPKSKKRRETINLGNVF